MNPKEANTSEPGGHIAYMASNGVATYLLMFAVLLRVNAPGKAAPVEPAAPVRLHP